MIISLKDSLKRQKIGKRLSYTFIIVIIIIITVILFVSNAVLYWTTLNRTKKEIQVNCELIAAKIDTIYTNTETCLKTLTKDINRVYDGSPVFGITATGKVSRDNQIYTAMNYSRNCFPDVSMMIFADEGKNVVVSGYAGVIQYDSLANLIVQIPAKGSAGVISLPIKEYSEIPGGNGNPRWVVGHRIINMNTGKNIGYLFAIINSDVLSESFPEKNSLDYSCEYQLINNDGEIVAARNSDYLSKFLDSNTFSSVMENKDFQIRESEGSYLVTSKKIDNGLGYLINKVKISDLMREIYYLLGVIVLVGLCSIVASIYIIGKVSRWITSPIEELTELAVQIRKDNLSVRYKGGADDEIGILGETINEMLEHIEILIKNITEAQKQKREYELALLQSQIKPHFLYNTLDLIYIFCETDKAKSGARMAKSLADYYRTSLSNGDEIVSIQNEIRNITSYLDIQKERYCDLIDFDIDVDKNLYECRIPKMTLQPLVENAIYHGLKEKGSKGKIGIAATLAEDAIEIIVEDDGVGMSQEMIESIFSGEKEYGKNHFGLFNVLKRIQLYYGEKYGLKVVSRLGFGTRAIITIPKEQTTMVIKVED